MKLLFYKERIIISDLGKLNWISKDWTSLILIKIERGSILSF